MRRFTAIAFVILFGLCTLVTVPSARALVVAQPTGSVKPALADLVVIGKVVAEEKGEATPTPLLKEKIPYTVAVIQVTEVLKGNVAGDKVHVGSVTNPATIKTTGVTVIKLAVGQSGLFYLKKHHDGEFYIVPMAGMFVSSQSKAAYEQEISDVRKALPVLANPLGSLKAKDAVQRLEAVSILLPVYRTAPPNAKFKMEPVAAEESKLLLKTLLDADWDANKYKGPNFRQNPALLFDMLGLGPKQGFQDPKKGKLTAEYASAARAWLMKNWQSYQLERVVISQ